MASNSAKAVARELSAILSKGGKKRANLAAILLKHGYSKSVSRSPSRVTQTQSFKEEMAPVVDQLEEERQAIMLRMKTKRRSAGYSTLVYALDVVNKNLQLLKGKPTSIQFGAHVNLSKEEKEKLDRLLG